MANTLDRYLSPVPPKLNGYSREMYLEVIQKAIEEGLTLEQAAASPGMPSTPRVYSWAVRDPEIGRRLSEYRQVRAYALDQEVEDIADLLTDMTTELSATQVRRLEVATKSKQWLAAHRFPQIFGERGPQQPTMTVTINTNLPMGEESATPGVFSVHAEVPTPRTIEGEWEEEQPGEEEPNG